MGYLAKFLKNNISKLLRYYFSDALKLEKIRGRYFSYFHRKIQGNSTYSVISSCHNAEKYIDSYIESLIYQTLDFRSNIQLVLVDDGSTDDTWGKLNKWMLRYPRNIIAVRQPNDDLSGAFNTGMKYATHDWVCFANVQDYFDCHAFERVDEIAAFSIQQNISFISLNIICFYEKQKKISDSHPLRYKYYFPVTVRQIKFLDDYIQTLSNSIFIKKDLLKHHYFSNVNKSSFKDSFFINSLFLDNEEKNICFLKEAKYFYNTKNKLSFINNPLVKKDLLSVSLEYGILELMRKAVKKHGKIPSYVQNTILYHTYQYFKELRNNNEPIASLSFQERERFVELLEDCYQQLDPNLIIKFLKGGVKQDLTTQISFFYKKKWDESRLVHIACFDYVKQEIQLRFFLRYKGEPVDFFFGGKGVRPTTKKLVTNTFCGRIFSFELICWLPLNIHKNECLQVFIDKKQTILQLKEKNRASFWTADILNSFYLLKRKLTSISPYSSCWIICDRADNADDNGEHFYKFLMKEHPEVNAWFLLDKKSTDWDRLKKEGFRLLALGSSEHRTALQFSKIFISSQIETRVINAFNFSIDKKLPFVFLQHGVAKEDLSTWFNSKEIALLVTSTSKERDTILSENSRYRLTNKEVQLTGLPRFDNLLHNCHSREKIILVAPTWRRTIVGNYDKKYQRIINKDFFKSNYAKGWISLLNNPYLLELIKAYNYKIVFLPHPEIQPYLKKIFFFDNINILPHRFNQVQDLLKRASLLITDYSSLDFDFAYIEKGVIYFQFDQEEVFAKYSHIYEGSCFDYGKEGFGPIAKNEGDLIRELRLFLLGNCIVPPVYLNRMKRTFPFKDGGNCDRVYLAICNMLGRSLEKDGAKLTEMN